jgi:hypothetical protein
VFWIAGKRDLATWEYLVRVVRFWDQIEKQVAAGPGPWFVAINEGGLKPLDV